MEQEGNFSKCVNEIKSWLSFVVGKMVNFWQHFSTSTTGSCKNKPFTK